MDNKGLSLEGVTTATSADHSPVQEAIRREIDSLDDFEHLGHDSSPLKAGDVGDLSAISPARDELGAVINTGVGVTNPAANKITDDLSSFDPLQSRSPFDNSQKMDSNLLEMGDHFPDRKEADDKLDKFLQEMTSFAPKHQEPPEFEDKDGFGATERFVETERGSVEPKKTATDQLERYSDSEPDDDDFKPSKYEDFPKKVELPESFGSSDNFKSETYKDVEEFEPKFEPVKEKTPQPVKEKTPEPVKEKAPEPVKEKTPEPVKEKTPEPVKERAPTPPTPVKEKVPEKRPEIKEAVSEADVSKAKKQAVIDAEAIFCRMGLDAWFNPERLNPKVESLIYWRDPKKSGPVFGGVLLVLLALTYFSLISVVAYLSLLVLTGTISFRIYKNIVQAVQKTGDGHPFKDLLEIDASLPQDKVKEVLEVAVAHINAGVLELRRLFLVEDLVDSIKFGVLLWTLTYLGAWFNGMTLIIIAWVALFTLPKVYEANKTQIDANLEIVRTKLADITSKVKAAIPIGKKTPEEKKEQ